VVLTVGFLLLTNVIDLEDVEAEEWFRAESVFPGCHAAWRRQCGRFGKN
jgi:hypothetical protein